MPMLAPWYAHDVYVSYYHGPRQSTELGVGREALDWIQDAIGELADMLAASVGSPVSFYEPQREDGSNAPLSAADREAIGAAAVWLVFLTPEYGRSEACLQEASGFIEAMKNGPRSNTQLIVCELLPLDAAQKASLPWHAAATLGAGVGAPTTRPLYDRFTRTAINDGDRITAERRALARDLQSRLEGLAKIQDATDAVTNRGAVGGPLDQVYLFKCLEPNVWQTSRNQLAKVSLAVNPAAMEAPGLAPRKDRQRLRERRRLLLENSLGLVVLRSSAEEDLELLASETVGDMKDLGRLMPSVFVDWLSEPQAAWPDYFSPERIDARQAGWAAMVVQKLQALAAANGQD
jgi:hypothetical protein